MNTLLSDDEIQSRTIDWLRFPLAISIVYLHMNPEVNMAQVNWQQFSYADLFQIISAFCSDVLPQIAVPCFFLFSGYLFFYKLNGFNTAIYQKKLQKRSISLLIPYILWNLLIVGFFFVLKERKITGEGFLYLQEIVDKGLWRIFWNISEWGASNTNFLGWSLPSYGPALVAFWFVRDLIVMTLLSPLVYFMIKRGKQYAILFLGILYYTKIGISIPGYSTDLFLTACFFFSLGAYFSIHNQNMVDAFRKHKRIAFGIAIIMLLLSTAFAGTEFSKFFLPVYVIAGVVSVINIAADYIATRGIQVSNTLCDASFFIYATHPGWLLGHSKLWVNNLFDTLASADHFFNMLLKYFTAPLFCVSIIMICYYLAQRFTPRLLSILTGSRQKK